MNAIYLDYNATTPVDPRVVERMLPYLQNGFGNPSSDHPYGTYAREAVKHAREQVANMLGCEPEEIVFTSGASEANNLAIRGIASARRDEGNHIITSCVEHPAVLNVCRYLEADGYEVTLLPVDRSGLVDPEDVSRCIRSDTILITIMHANNETGTLQPIREISIIAKEAGVPLHTDAAQSVGKVPVDVNDLGVQLLSIAGHKFYAPKGIGALFVRRGIVLDKLIHGADHERDLRAGTENVPGIAGLGEAAELAARDLPSHGAKMKETRDLLQEKLLHGSSPAMVNGHLEHRLPNTLSIGFPGIQADALLSKIQQRVAASAGAACHSGGVKISHVLKAMGVDPGVAKGTIRFSTGRMTSTEEVRTAADVLENAIREHTR